MCCALVLTYFTHSFAETSSRSWHDREEHFVLTDGDDGGDNDRPLVADNGYGTYSYFQSELGSPESFSYHSSEYTVCSSMST